MALNLFAEVSSVAGEDVSNRSLDEVQQLTKQASAPVGPGKIQQLLTPKMNAYQAIVGYFGKIHHEGLGLLYRGRGGY